jgi:hypothetical protein
MSIHSRVPRRQLSLTLYVLLLGVIIPLCAAPAASQTITVESACGVPGTSVWFNVFFDPEDMSIAGTQNDITFNSINAPIATCTVNSALNKTLSMSFLPNGCTGTGCTTVRGLIYSMTNTGPIRSPIVLFSCRVDIPGGATLGSYALTIGNVSGSDPLTNPMPIAGVSGQITVAASCGC